MAEQQNDKAIAPARGRSYSIAAWLMIGCAALFAIAPAKEIAFIVMGFLMGAALSFGAQSASRRGWPRLAFGLFVFGLVAIAGMFVVAPEMHRQMMKPLESERAKQNEARQNVERTRENKAVR